MRRIENSLKIYSIYIINNIITRINLKTAHFYIKIMLFSHPPLKSHEHFFCINIYLINNGRMKAVSFISLPVSRIFQSSRSGCPNTFVLDTNLCVFVSLNTFCFSKILRYIMTIMSYSNRCFTL